MKAYKPNITDEVFSRKYNIPQMMQDENLAAKWNNEEAVEAIKILNPKLLPKQLENFLIEQYIQDYESRFRNSSNDYEKILKHPLITSEHEMIMNNERIFYQATKLKIAFLAISTSAITTFFVIKGRYFGGNFSKQITYTILFPGLLFLGSWNTHSILGNRRLKDSLIFKKYEKLNK